MKRLRAILGGAVMFGLLAMIPMGCSDSDSGSSPVPPDIPTNRIYVMTIGSGVLTPAFESAEGMTDLNAEPNRDYMLTLDDVTKNTLWYTNRPERKTGTTTVQRHIHFITGPHDLALGYRALRHTFVVALIDKLANLLVLD